MTQKLEDLNGMREFSLEQSDTSPYRWIITGKTTGILIEVYPSADNFITNENELQYYVSHDGGDVFFQTVAYHHQKVAYVEAGINWFVTVYLKSHEQIIPLPS